MSVELVSSFVLSLENVFFGLHSRLALFFLCSSVVLVFLIWLVRGAPGSFIRFLLPKEVYLHRSNLVDIQVFLANILVAVLGVTSAVLFTPLVVSATITSLTELTGHGASIARVTWIKSAVATIIIVLTMDFCKYWAHWLHHENRILWPFHALHHSAEVLTPLTVQRKHPVFVMVQNAFFSVVLGAATGMMLFLFIGEIDILTIGGANAAYFLFNLLGANLRHSHVWLSYGPILEHILISPAQHQIHHSRAVKHHNKNYGEVFAFWDWMFGTLYVPKEHEELEFGLADAKGNVIQQPHPNLARAFLTPFSESMGELFGVDIASRKTQRIKRRAAEE